MSAAFRWLGGQDQSELRQQFGTDERSPSTRRHPTLRHKASASLPACRTLQLEERRHLGCRGTIASRIGNLVEVSTSSTKSWARGPGLARSSAISWRTRRAVHDELPERRHAGSAQARVRQGVVREERRTRLRPDGADAFGSTLGNSLAEDVAKAELQTQALRNTALNLPVGRRTPLFPRIPRIPAAMTGIPTLRGA